MTPISHSLRPHPDTPAGMVRAVCVEILGDTDDLRLRYIVEGAEALLLPAPGPAERVDGLWRTTCFELFLRPAEQSGYLEFNFSPCSNWAAYRFDGYRSGMATMTMPGTPAIAIEGNDPFTLVARLKMDAELRHADLAMAVAAVIEETDGTKSYWALAHAPGPPDFHHPDCFIAGLSARRRP